MILQGIFNILELYLENIDIFYNNIDNYFQEKINKNFKNIPLKNDKLSLTQILEDITLFLTKQLEDLGFQQEVIKTRFLDPFLEIRKEDLEFLNSPLDIFKKKFLPIIYEIFLENIIYYLVNIDVAVLMLKFKSKGLLPLELIIELRNLKNLFEKQLEKEENLRKYIQIQEKVVKKFLKNKIKIEKLEDLKDPRDKLQLLYLIYRIIDFFHVKKQFDFSHIKEYLKNNIDEWLIDIPLITLKNPDIYFCGIYLAKHLNVEIDKKKVIQFLLNLYEEAIDEYDVPLLEATDGTYYFLKSTELMKLRLTDEQISNLIKGDQKFFESNYLRNLETSQLVVILKLYKYLGIRPLDYEIKAIIDEIEVRITSEGIKQYRDGFISSEATYYVLFCNYMRNTLEKLKDYNILEKIISIIYRNLEFLSFSKDINYDLVSETFYSFESLKLFNCIETKQMIIHLAKYLFPEQVYNKILNFKEISKREARFRHLKVNKITGETIY
ncbi:MAG: hypothetical protein ACFFA6_03355 [Promethearchaeota archaeon]